MRQQEIEDRPAKDVIERTSVPPAVRRNSSSYQDGIGPVAHTVDRSVNWLELANDHTEEEAVMQILGAGHWFLEGWTGDWWIRDPR